jgi:phosphoesterase RecJ-like protein
MSEPRLSDEFAPVAAAMLERLRAATGILIPTHINVDGDTLASVLALSRALSGLGKAVVPVVSDGKVPHALQFLCAADSPILYTGQALPPFDLIFFADITGPSRLGPLAQALGDRLTPEHLFNVDHHVSNERFAALNLVDVGAAATAEVLYLLLRGWGIPITAELATPLLAGVMTDTLSFQTPSTTARTLHVAADLVAAGAPLEHLADALFRAKPLSTARLFGAVVDSARLDDGLLCAEVTQAMLAETGAQPSETEDVVSYLSGVEEAAVFALFYERADGWRVSLRSSTDAIDVSRLAAEFGGGGHARAAGLTLVGGRALRTRFVQRAKTVIAAARETVAAGA